MWEIIKFILPIIGALILGKIIYGILEERQAKKRAIIKMKNEQQEAIKKFKELENKTKSYGKDRG